MMERLLARAPGPRLMWVTAFVLVPIAAAFISDSYVATVGQASFRTRVLAGTVYAYAVGLSFFAIAFFQARVEAVRDSLNTLGVAETDPDIFAPLPSVVGPLALTGVFAVATTLRTWMLTDAQTALAWLPVTFLTNLPVMSTFFIYLVLLLGLNRLGRKEISLRAFPQDPSLGLAPAGRLAYAAFWVFVAASIPILVINSGDTLRLALTFVAFVGGIAVFFSSIWRLHRRLVEARSDYIDHARRLYAEAYKAVRSSSLDALEKHAQTILAARAIEKDANSIQRWPFDDRRLRGIAAIVGTVITFTGTGIITRLVYEELIL